MKKTLFYTATGFVGISLIAAFAGKITFEQFGYITPLVLSIVYGVYQKVLSNEKDETITSLNFTIEDIIQKSNRDIKFLEKTNHMLVKELVNLEENTNLNEFVSDEDPTPVEYPTPVEKPKRTRKAKK